MDEYYRYMSSEQRQQVAQRAGTLAVERYNKGLNCAESALYGAARALDLTVPDALLQAATAFGGGMGKAGGPCGALSGAVMALGLVYGRTVADAQKKNVAYEHSQRLYHRFVERTGSQDCRDLNTLGFDHPDHKAQCAHYVAIAAELAVMELLGI